jgi:hypothetical protein
VQERAGNTLEPIDIGNEFLNRTQMAQQVKERIDKWDYMTLKTFTQQKKWSLNQRGYQQNRRKSLPPIHQQGINNPIYRELKTLNP